MKNAKTKRMPPTSGQFNPDNCVWVACGDEAWERMNYDCHRVDRLSTILPPGDEYKWYRWPVKDQDCILLNTGGISENYLRDFASYLVISQKAKKVLVLCDELDYNPTYKSTKNDFQGID